MPAARPASATGQALVPTPFSTKPGPKAPGLVRQRQENPHAGCRRMRRP